MENQLAERITDPNKPNSPLRACNSHDNELSPKATSPSRLPGYTKVKSFYLTFRFLLIIKYLKKNHT